MLEKKQRRRVLAELIEKYSRQPLFVRVRGRYFDPFIFRKAIKKDPERGGHLFLNKNNERGRLSHLQVVAFPGSC